MKSLLLLLVLALLAINVYATEESTFLMVDVDNDGEADLKLSASQTEGAFDTIEHLEPVVTNQKAKSKLLDVDGDGQPDLRLVDSNKDGLYDQVNMLEAEAEAEAEVETEVEAEAEAEMETESGAEAEAEAEQEPTTEPTPTPEPTPVPTPTEPAPEVVQINPEDPIPTDGVVLKKPLIWPPPPANKVNKAGVSFGAPPANLTKPVIVDNTVAVPKPRRRSRCPCRNRTTKPKEYRNDVQYRLKKKSLKVRTPCPCRRNRTRALNTTALPPIVAKLYPVPKNLTKYNVTCVNGTRILKKKKVVKLAPEYKLRRKSRQNKLQPCAKNATSTRRRNSTIRPKLRPLTWAQKKLTNVSFAN